tara:strand:+ start:11653 stop:11946 length:294 start_codon:yes stop_codon:yes gene_type:complete
MVKETTFNGWVNYETWAVNLWLTNDEDTNKQLDKILKNFITPQRKADKLRVLVQDWMYDYIRKTLDNENGMFIDLLRSAVNNVNWDAIIEHHKHDFD